ncbi:hypothetical protein EV175_003566, partial [Coemansia sp. RSA 1933]
MRGFTNLKHQLKLGLLGWMAASSATAAAAGQQRSLVKRLDTSAIDGMKGALLIKNGGVTTCELALISNKAAFVAANCLDYTDGTNTVDSSTVYQVMISDGNTSTIGTYSVDTVDAHPRYNPETYANNVALLLFNSDASVEWKNYIAADPSEWDSEFYVQRTLVSNSTSSKWNGAQVVQASGSAPSGCSTASTLYAANQADFLCTTDTVSDSSSGANCVMPYGSVYGINGDNLAVAGLYSHSLVVGDSLCSNSAVFNYYTLLSNYLEWGGVMAKSTIYLFAVDQSYVNNDKANYTMANPSGSASVSGVLMGGDLYAIPEASSSSSSVESSTSSSATESSTDEPSSSSSESEESSSSEEGDDGKSGSSHIALILIIVGVVLLVIGIIIFLIWRRNKKRKAARAAHEQYQANMYNDNHSIGGQEDRFSAYE